MSEIGCDSKTDTKWSRGRKAVPGKGGGAQLMLWSSSVRQVCIVLSPTGPGSVLKARKLSLWEGDLDVRSCGQAWARHK